MKDGPTFLHLNKVNRQWAAIVEISLRSRSVMGKGVLENKIKKNG